MVTGVAKRETAWDVQLFIPNLIGYTRVIMTILAYWFMLPGSQNAIFGLKGWQLCLVCYSISFIADAIDGMAARHFGQSSEFGAVLDMVTDRCSTAGFLLLLSHVYPDYKLSFTALLVLDIGSHWFQMKQTSEGEHHKKGNSNLIVKLFYENKLFFGYCCVGAEFFYIFLYAVNFCDPNGAWYAPLYTTCFYICLPGCMLKQFVNFVQLGSAATIIAAKDAKKRNAAASE